MVGVDHEWVGEPRVIGIVDAEIQVIAMLTLLYLHARHKQTKELHIRETTPYNWARSKVKHGMKYIGRMDGVMVCSIQDHPSFL